jgi:translation initiation factor IF-1
LFRIRVDNGVTLVGNVSAQMRQFTVKILPGDRVSVEVSAYDPSRGRIIRRLK